MSSGRKRIRDYLALAELAAPIVARFVCMFRKHSKPDDAKHGQPWRCERCNKLFDAPEAAR